MRIGGLQLSGRVTLAPMAGVTDSAFRTPEGDLGNYVMDMAENDPDMFGMSVVIKGKRV